MKKIKKFIVAKANAFAIFFTVLYFNIFAARPVFADQLSAAAESAATGIQVSAESIVKWIVVIVFVIGGFVFIGIGGHRAKENFKDSIWEKLVGVAMIILAVPLAVLVFDLF